MKMIKTSYSLLLFLFSISVFAQNGAYQTYKFLNVNPTAKSVAMGNSGISQQDNDLGITLLNPALLNRTCNNQASLNYLNYISDSHFGFVAFAQQKKIGMLQASLLYFNGGKFVQTDETSTITGNFKVNETAFMLSWSKQLDSVLQVGATAKYIFSALESYRSQGLAFDLGATYTNPQKNFTAGIVAKNIGFQLKSFAGTKANLPLDVQLGLSYKLEHVPFRISLTAVQLNRYNLVYVDTTKNLIDPITNQVIEPSKRTGANILNHFVVGGELLLAKVFQVRLGYNFKRRDELKVESYPSITGLSFGFGIKLHKMQIGYGYTRMHFYGNSNTFTINYFLGK